MMKLFITLLFAMTVFVTNLRAQITGNALHFDGLNDYVSCPLPSVFSSISSNDFTVEFWALPDVNVFQRLFYAQKDANNFACVSLNSSGEVVFYLQENGVNHSVQSTEVVPESFWKHIAVTWNSSTQEAKIFLDGEEVSYSAGAFVSSTGIDNTFTIGSRTDGSQFFMGKMDELSIWDHPLLPCEIKFEKNTKKTGSEMGLSAYYNFDHGTPGVPNIGIDGLQDFTGNMNDGVLNNFALIGINSNWVISPPSLIHRWFGDPSPVWDAGSTHIMGVLGAYMHQWIDCSTNTAVVGATDYIFNPPVEDPNYNGGISYYAVISTEGTCVDTSECVEYTLASLDESNQESRFSVYPNPSNGNFTVDLPINAEEVEILSLNGELIERFIPTEEAKIQFELTNLSGMYIVRVKTKSGVLSSKISIQGNQ